MIRTCAIWAIVCLAIADSSAADYKNHDYGKLEIDKVDRIVSLNGPYAEEIAKVIVRNLGSDPTKVFYHVVTRNISNSIADIKFNSQNELQFTKQETYDGYTLFKVELAGAILGADATITITTRYINRYRNLPAQVSMLDDQLLEFTDYRYFFSPYKVNQQNSVYKFQKIISATPAPNSKEFTSIRYSQSSPITNFNKERVVVHGLNNNPQMIFTEVEKVIEVSHWGNIAISEKYKILNQGPELKGQFSRVEYNPYNENAGKNSFKKTQATLPGEAWGLYYRDEVGNISTSRAYRDTKTNSVKFQITPRFGIFGGWRSNWEIGYNLPTEGFLFRDDNHFELSQLPLGYELDRVIAENFKLTLILPEGASNIKIFMEGLELKYTTSTSFSFLDFVGRPAINLERKMSGRDVQKNFKLTYDYNSKSLLRKPFLVFVTLFSVLVLVIVTGRLELKTLHIDKY